MPFIDFDDFVPRVAGTQAHIDAAPQREQHGGGAPTETEGPVGVRYVNPDLHPFSAPPQTTKRAKLGSTTEPTYRLRKLMGLV